jgi:alcohol dehydrogenase YqhD (iron-dependent ADH family)
MRTDPTMVSDLDLPNAHRQTMWRNFRLNHMVRVGYVDPWAEHVLASNLDVATRIEHDVSIEVVQVTDTNTLVS